ncbi:hypothetical protein MHYP_G00035210 [Metynnis hypsauchen]
MTCRSKGRRPGIRHSKLRPVCERETGLRSSGSAKSVQTALDVIMEDEGGFQTQFASVMENVLKVAVGEATKLFERTLQQLRAELVRLRQENVDLKTGAFPHQFKTRLAAEGAQRTEQTAGPPRRDVGVQCEKPLMVERCCSPAPIGLQLPDIASDGLADLCSSATEDGNRQLALLLIKKEPQETDCDDYAPGYFLLKQEGAEPILVRKEPFRNTMERVTIPSTFQTVTRCYGNPREISTACTSSTTNPAPTTNTVSCNNRVDYSNNKVTQTTNQFFPPPDNASDLLQPLPPMPFHSPIVLTQQEAALEQPSMIHSQSSGQPLQLAPLLTPKEQQAAACNQVQPSVVRAMNPSPWTCMMKTPQQMMRVAVLH